MVLYCGLRDGGGGGGGTFLRKAAEIHCIQWFAGQLPRRRRQHADSWGCHYVNW